MVVQHESNIFKNTVPAVITEPLTEMPYLHMRVITFDMKEKISVTSKMYG